MAGWEMQVPSGVVAGLLVGVVALAASRAEAQAPAAQAEAPAPAAPAATAPAPASPSVATPPPAAQFPNEAPPAPAVQATADAERRAAATPSPTPPSAPRPAPPAPQVQDRPNWNIGAGVILPMGLSALQLGSVPTYAAIIERRVAASTWLTFNVAAAYDSRDVSLRPFGPEDVLQRQSIKVYSGTASLLLGLRHTLVHRVVEVSVAGAAVAARQNVWRDDLREGETIASLETTPSQSYSVGLQAGMTLERQVIEGLALRLALDAASVTFTRTDAATIDSLAVATPTTRHGLRAALTLQAGLQLHFYF